MNKCRTVKKSGVMQFLIKSQKGQQLSEREVHAINNNEVMGMLKLETVKKPHSFSLIYNITGLITLRDFLKSPLDKETFAGILNNILSNLKSMQESFFNQQGIIMDFNYVMMDPENRKIYFVYVPIPSYDCSITLRDFLLGIIRFGSFTSGEDTSYVREYISILNSGVNFSVFELEEYIKSLSGSRITASSQNVECPKCHSMIQFGKNYCPMCGTRMSGDTGIPSDKIYDPWTASVGFHSKPSEPMAETGKDKSVPEAITYPDPYLIRMKNNEKIFVDKSAFRIGKGRQNIDYLVLDNKAVSRSHADIITKDNKYYIVDLNSTNKTYMNGEPIPAETEIEIYSGTEIRLADEDFTFYTGTRDGDQ